MSAIVIPAADGTGVPVTAPRVVSIDIFRGLTMAVMIFVNELSGVPNMPWWTEHAPGRLDYMTYVDMVFPFFLFIVGMSMPLSIEQRLKKNPSMGALWWHVVSRFISLLVLGLVLANADDADRARMGMSGATWGLLSILCAGLYLNVYAKANRFLNYSRALRIVGLVGVIVLFALYRRTTSNGLAGWLQFGYPEILGLIAYSYLAAAVLYIPTRRWKWAAPAWFLIMLALNVLSAANVIRWLVHLPWWFWPFSNGSMVCLIFGGIITTWIFLGRDGRVKRPDVGRAMAIATGLGVLMPVAARILTPLGISKIRATPTWTLYSIGGSMLLFTLLYWICDVKGWTNWAFVLKPAGSNTLTTYLLPDVWYFLFVIFGFTFYNAHFSTGWTAVVKTFVFTFFILGVAALLTKLRVRLQL